MYSTAAWLMPPTEVQVNASKDIYSRHFLADDEGEAGRAITPPIPDRIDHTGADAIR